MTIDSPINADACRLASGKIISALNWWKDTSKHLEKRLQIKHTELATSSIAFLSSELQEAEYIYELGAALLIQEVEEHLGLWPVVNVYRSREDGELRALSMLPDYTMRPGQLWLNSKRIPLHKPHSVNKMIRDGRSMKHILDVHTQYLIMMGSATHSSLYYTVTGNFPDLPSRVLKGSFQDTAIPNMFGVQINDTYVTNKGIITHTNDYPDVLEGPMPSISAVYAEYLANLVSMDYVLFSEKVSSSHYWGEASQTGELMETIAELRKNIRQLRSVISTIARELIAAHAPTYAKGSDYWKLSDEIQLHIGYAAAGLRSYRNLNLEEINKNNAKAEGPKVILQCKRVLPYLQPVPEYIATLQKEI